MAGETTITVVGNLTDDPELRFTPSGAAVAKFRIASTPRTLDRASGEWKDGGPLFLACNIWSDAAAHAAEGGRAPLPCVQHLARRRRARRRVAAARRSGDRAGPAAPAVVRDA